MLISDNGEAVTVTASPYTWTYTRSTDRFVLADWLGRPALSGPAQPAVVVTGGWCAGQLDSVEVGPDWVGLGYTGTGSGRVSVTWNFTPEWVRLEPIEVTLTEAVDIVRLVWFAAPGDGSGDPEPGLTSRYLVHPGVAGSAAISPIIKSQANLDMTTWLGRGGSGRASGRQQWGLPVHYVVALDSAVHPVQSGAMTSHLSDAVCLGLADLPAGDLFLTQRSGCFSPVLEVRSDVWGHLRGPGTWQLGAPWVLALGTDVRDAVRGYQRALVEWGRVQVQHAEGAKAGTLTAPQFNTWGAQITAGQAFGHFDQSGLEAIYKQADAADLRSELFIVDAKWEGRYGELAHDRARFPDFEGFLERARADGRSVGLWAAFLRCDDAAALGLTDADLLRGPDGAPLVLGPHAEPAYRLLDVTSPAVERVLRERIAAFVARYHPSLVKFDFGYEVPDLSVCAPSDMAFAGERYLQRALEVVVGALRAADPEIAVMYYSLSPLLTDLIDLHSTDDPWMGAGEYHAEIGRRIWFSGPLAELGIPTYGSGGYDWTHQTDIWLDSVAHGPLGALGSFTGDHSDSEFTRRHAAVYAGLARIRRRTTVFRVDAQGDAGLGAATGARSSSWSRTEDDRLTLVALRPRAHLGSPGVAEMPGLVATTAPVVVASLDDDGLDTTKRIGVVPFEAGELELTTTAAEARVAVHSLDGHSHVRHVQITDGLLIVPLTTHLDGDDVTWLEITL